MDVRRGQKIFRLSFGNGRKRKRKEEWQKRKDEGEDYLSSKPVMNFLSGATTLFRRRDHFSSFQRCLEAGIKYREGQFGGL